MYIRAKCLKKRMRHSAATYNETFITTGEFRVDGAKRAVDVEWDEVHEWDSLST